MGTRFLPLISFPQPARRRPDKNPKSSVYPSPNFSSNLHSSTPNFVSSVAPRDRSGYGSRFDFAADVEGRLGFRSREKRRNWWSDEDDDEDNDADDSLFGLWEDPRTTDLVLKVLGTFGWIVPNIIMSSMLDTGDRGQDAIIMMLMLPLGQVAINFVMDRIQESSGHTPNRKRRRKRKPFGRSASRSRQGNKTRKRSYRTGQEKAGYHTWSDTDSSFSKSSLSFGGWDELDQQVDNLSDFPGTRPRKDEIPKEQSEEYSN